MFDKKKFLTAVTFLFESKNKTYTEATLTAWYELLKDFPEGEVLSGIKKLTYSKDDFISVGKVLNSINRDFDAEVKRSAEKAWYEVINSARNGGKSRISARSAKALNSLGGMAWLRDADSSNTNWQRKEFLEIYTNTPEPNNTDFRCYGLEAPMYLENSNIKLLEE